MGPISSLVIPSYGQVDYFLATIDSLFADNSERFAIFLDDASPEWGRHLHSVRRLNTR